MLLRKPEAHGKTRGPASLSSHAPPTEAPAAEPVPPPPVTRFEQFLPFLAVAAQFYLIVLLIPAYHLESMTFAKVLKFSFFAFLIHHFLPERFRLPSFALFSVAITGAVGETAAGLTLAVIGLGIVGACLLPIAYWWRVGLIALIGVALSIARANSDAFPAIVTMWAALGSMFAFRLIVYLYDLKNKAAPFGPARTTAYFFMVPNVCFPLFPIVDYKTFCATYYNDDAIRIYQKGIKWMFRGVVQLLLYRLVYHYALLNIEDVANARDAAEFMLATYLLYLHVSGQFHLIVGMLHMFGFNLPETHHLYLLASSFTDFWRRINIYWKDFIMKVFFYPAFFALRKLGPMKAMALATLAAFFATWVLHSWQWFWLRGRFLLTWQDVSFWTILALLVTVNALIEAKYPKRRSLSKPRFDLRERLITGAKTIATFTVICGLWTLWSCQSWGELEVLAESAGRGTWLDYATIVAGLLVIGVAAMIWGGSTRESSQGLKSAAARAPEPPARFWLGAAGVAAGSIALLALSAIGPGGPDSIRSVFVALREDQLNAADIDRQRRGYYEELDMARSGQFAWGRIQETPPGWRTEEFFVQTDDFLIKQMAPSSSGYMGGVLATTNRWSMRDRDYEKAKPPGTYRILMLGSSHEVGTGVKDGEEFENLVEDRLNQRGPHVPKVEILNYSESGYGTLRKLLRLEKSGLDFQPDAVLFFVNLGDRMFDLEDISRAIRTGKELPFDFVRSLVDRLRLTAHHPDLVIQYRLKPYMPEMYSRAFERLAETCRKRGIRAYVAYRPSPLGINEVEKSRRAELITAALGAGLEVLDLSDAFDGVADRDTLVLASFDDHTNAKGHQLLADALYKRLEPRLPTNADGPPAGQEPQARPSTGETRP